MKKYKNIEKRLQQKRDSYHRNKHKKGIVDGVRRSSKEIVSLLAPEELAQREIRIKYNRSWREKVAAKEGRILEKRRRPVGERTPEDLKKENLEACRRYRARYPERRKQSANAWVKRNLHKPVERRKIDIQFNLRHKLRCRIYEALRRTIKGKFTKRFHTTELIGCSYEELKDYLESKFTNGMTWARLLNGEIQIDHVVPCVAFDLTDPEEQKKCFHYSNLQPLWWKDNLMKSDKLDWKPTET